jgi:hypothetical protein
VSAIGEELLLGDEAEEGECSDPNRLLPPPLLLIGLMGVFIASGCE